MEFSKFLSFVYQLELRLSSQIHHEQSHTNTLGFFIFEVLGKFNFWNLYREILILSIRKFQFSVYREILILCIRNFHFDLFFVYQHHFILSSQIHHQQSKLRIEKFLKFSQSPKVQKSKVLGKFNFSNLYREILIPRMWKIQIFKFSFFNFYPL